MSVQALVGVLCVVSGLLGVELACASRGEPANRHQPTSQQALSLASPPPKPTPLVGTQAAGPVAGQQLESRLNFVTSKRAVVNREMNLQVQIHRGQAPFQNWDWAESARDRIEHSPEGEALSLLRYVKLDLQNAGDFRVTPLDNLAEPRDLSQQELLKWNFIVVPLKAGECRLWIRVITSPAQEPFLDQWETVKVYKVTVIPDETWIRRAQHAVEEMTGLMKALSALLAATATVLGYLGFRRFRKHRTKGKAAHAAPRKP